MLKKQRKQKSQKKQANSFKEKVLHVVRKIPRGKTLSYKTVALRAGNPRAARVVGMIMARNDDISIPCHRVIRSDGKIGGYNGLRGSTKENLLREESA